MIHPSCTDRSSLGARLFLALALVFGGVGCGLFDMTTDVGISVFAAHHPRRGDDGKFPEYGFDNKPRTWTNDAGWEVNLTESYIVITGASLVACDGTEYPLSTPFGPLPEYLNWTDFDVTVLGSTEIPEGDYCDLRVDYGPYRAEAAAMANEDPHVVPSGRDLEGITIFLAGRAIKDDMTVDFALISGESNSSVFELREGDGMPAPFTVVDEGGGLKATIGKTYDRFFDGIDFATYEADSESINAGLMTILVEETRAYRGTTIY
ncbi:MAG TPA: hypothetical protein ENJ18_00130 [Nannocystis exedens]|nr:hypothetical protein [Nannocystis exedens]